MMFTGLTGARECNIKPPELPSFTTSPFTNDFRFANLFFTTTPFIAPYIIIFFFTKIPTMSSIFVTIPTFSKPANAQEQELALHGFVITDVRKRIPGCEKYQQLADVHVKAEGYDADVDDDDNIDGGAQDTEETTEQSGADDDDDEHRDSSPGCYIIHQHVPGCRHKRPCDLAVEDLPEVDFAENLTEVDMANPLAHFGRASMLENIDEIIAESHLGPELRPLSPDDSLDRDEALTVAYLEAKYRAQKWQVISDLFEITTRRRLPAYFFRAKFADVEERELEQHQEEQHQEEQHQEEQHQEEQHQEEQHQEEQQVQDFVE
ncbi:hypothetical protein GGR50DRAFT_262925 [Xylaria sp. CBS 124048]|nr:hypothetical protein GGR50DRAFT_262925 [Xylaria sp. CBS 124048]